MYECNQNQRHRRNTPKEILSRIQFIDDSPPAMKNINLLVTNLNLKATGNLGGINALIPVAEISAPSCM
jgi:hypothetical protein